MKLKMAEIESKELLVDSFSPLTALVRTVAI